MNIFLSLLFLVGTKFASYKFDAAQKKCLVAYEYRDTNNFIEIPIISIHRGVKANEVWHKHSKMQYDCREVF